MVSENGWPLVDASQLDTTPIPEVDIVPVPGLLKGDVAWLLKWVALQFNNRVAGLYNPGCWGWNAPTPIPGTNVYSNHCSGTAIDLDAPSFPWTLDTMTPAQKAACRDIVAQTEGVVGWGGDFTTKLDQMHFEISGNADDVARIVEKLKEDEVSKPTQEQVLSQFRSYEVPGYLPNGDPSQGQLDYYSARSWDVLNDDLLNAKTAQWRAEKAKSEIYKAKADASQPLTADEKSQIAKLTQAAQDAINKIGQLAK